jgi:large subunit ribosomal protein L25
MAHDTPTINAVPRDRTGSRFAKRLRDAGRLPAIIYGHQIDPQAVSVDEKEVLTHLGHGTHVFFVNIEGAATETCLVKDLQFGYLGDNVIHVDFARVDLDEEVEVNVRLHFVGAPKAAIKPGAVVNHPLNELEVICKVNAIPDEIRVDASKTVEDMLTVGEIELPPGVRTEVDPETPVLVVSIIAEEEAAGEAAEVAGVESAEPEVITEAKVVEKEAEGD